MTKKPNASPNSLPSALRELLDNLPPLAIAFSGGLDSRFLCHACALTDHDILAIHATGPHVAPDESTFARAWAKKRGIRLMELSINPLELPEVLANARDRCYFCKKNLFAHIRAALGQNGESARLLCDGGNLDDLALFRPGIQAVREARARSPLAEAGLDKKEIRALARATGMDFPDQAARPCLLTRFAYRLRPDAGTLARLAHTEKDIETILKKHGKDIAFRLRLLPEPVLHIVPGAETLHPELLAMLKDSGWNNAKVETVQSLSGYFDRNESS